MLLAHHLANWSIEKGRRVGAVIVGPDNEVRSTGFNGLPRGVRDDLEERHSRVTGAKLSGAATPSRTPSSMPRAWAWR